MSQGKRIIKREKLYEEVWSKPMTKLAAEYGLSDNGLAKVCKKLNVPRPEVGYWSKLAAGHKVNKKPLPALKEDTPNEYELSNNETKEKGVSEDILKLIEAEKHEQNKIGIPLRINKYHPLIQKTKQAVQGSSQNKGLFIRVSNESKARAYKLFDTLIKALEIRGHQVTLKGQERESETVVDILGEQIVIEMLEREKRAINPKYDPNDHWREPQYIYRPSGIIELQIKGYYYPFELDRRTVRDIQSKKIEDRLNEFIIFLLKAADKSRRNRVHDEEQRKIREEKERRQREFEEAFKKEKSKVEELFKNVDEYYRAYQIRLYIEAVINSHREAESGLSSIEELESWVKWANAQADRIDPLKKSPYSILDEINKLPWHLKY